MDVGPRRGRRRIARLAGGLLAALALLAAAVPLLLRGPVLRWAVARATEPLCGRITVQGGHFGLGLIPNLLLGRPLAVELLGVRLLAPDGGEVTAAERVTARLTVERGPWRFAVEDAVASRGHWRLAIGGAPGSGFLDVFRPVPRHGGRAACVAPRPAARPPTALPPPAPRAPVAFSSVGAVFAVRGGRLDEIDVDLDFPAWGLALSRVRCGGSFEVAASNGSPVLFEAHDARARGGVLRLGPARSRGVTRARFDDVAIPRVALARERPTDIVLEVSAGRTGRSTLHGRADFNRVFPTPGRREAPAPRLDLDARWDDVADAFGKLEAGWLPRGGTLEDVGLGGALTANLSGPFVALSGSASIEGPRARVAATIEGGRRAFLDVRSDGLALGPLVGPDLRPALAGTAAGRLRARALFAPNPDPNLDEREVAILDAELTLARAARDEGPRAVVVRVGPSAPSGRALALSRRDALEISVAQARYARVGLSVDDLRVRWAEGSARGGLTLSRPKPGSPARVEATLGVELASLARLVPPDAVALRLSARARVAGTLGHLAGSVTFGPRTSLSVLGEGFRVPRALTATLDGGRHLSLTRATFPHEGGGAVTAAGRVDLRGDVAGELRVVDYPLGDVPELGALRLPAALGQGREVPLDEALGGRVDATLSVRGPVRDPSFAGTAVVRRAALTGRPLGDGHVTARGRLNTISFEGTLGPSLSFESTITRRRRAIVAEGVADVRALALGPWLPPPFDGLDVLGSGHVEATLSTLAPPVVRGALSAEGPGARFTLDGELRGQATSGRVRGHVELAPLRHLWARWFSSADGIIELDLTGRTDLSHPMEGKMSGSISAARALALRPRGLGQASLTLGVAQGARIDLDGKRVSTPGLLLTADGVRLQLRGGATLDAAAPERSLLALEARGHLDAAVLARGLRLPALSSASGTIALDARATGEAAAPRASGQARLEGLTLVPASKGVPTLRLDGVVEADEHTLRTRGLVVRASELGALTVGAANAPASVEIGSWSPFVAGRLDVPVSARGLHVGDARASLEIGRLDLAVRATGDARGTVTVAGDVTIDDARFDSGRGAPSKPGRPRAWYEGLPPHLALDLTLRGPDDAVTVAVPGPDVRVGFACRVRATSRGGTIDGQLRGGTTYSRAALALYDWFTPRDVRRCRIFKE
jgi:hypothetical protein